MGIREDMPALARHEGVWDDTYTCYSAAGEKIDEHRSRLFCRFLDDEAATPSPQTNHSTWADGRIEIRDFSATYRDKRPWWDNALIVGSAREVGEDTERRAVMLYWQRTGDPSLYLYEIIQIADHGQSRCRTWHRIRNGEQETRIAIQETLVIRDWRALDAEREADAG